MRTDDPVIAILCADLHLQHMPPACRQNEPDWYAAMQRGLDELRTLCKRYNDCPILCAGDVFDRWGSPPKLINFALDYLPAMYAIPGQHDLPNHRQDKEAASAYGTLVRAGVITPVLPGKSIYLQHPMGGVCDLLVEGFPWGTPFAGWDVGAADGSSHAERVALVHQFLWIGKETGYPGAPESGRLSAMAGQLRGWDTVVFGDNHKGFLVDGGSATVLNCGTFYRRTTAEESYRPSVGLLRCGGKVTIHHLDISEDVLDVSTDPAWEPDQGLDQFVDSLQNLGGDPLDFKASMDAVMRECEPGVRGILAEVLGG